MERIYQRIDKVNERITQHEDKVKKLNHSKMINLKKQTHKKTKSTEHSGSLRNCKRLNLWVIGIEVEQLQVKDKKKLFSAKSCYVNLRKQILIKTQETYRSPNTKEPPYYIILKILAI